MTRVIFKSACRCSRAIRAGRWWMSGQRHRHRVGQAGCVGGDGGERGVAGKSQLSG